MSSYISPFWPGQSAEMWGIAAGGPKAGPDPVANWEVSGLALWVLTPAEGDEGEHGA